MASKYDNHLRKCLWVLLSRIIKRLAFISSTNEGNPPIDMNVTNPNTKDAHEPLACPQENNKPGRKELVIA